MRVIRVLHPADGPIWATEYEAKLHAVEGLFDSNAVGAELPADLKRLACVAPSKILCIGRNYAAHARELGNEVSAEPTLFWKPPSSIIADGEPIVRPRAFSEVVHHEGELGVVVGESLRYASLKEARAAIGGYVVANDVTARDLQRGDKTWARGKGFDTFCPVGPEIVTPDEAPEVEELRVKVFVDGELRQDGSCGNMVFTIPECLAYASQFFTLVAGDLLLTGTPEGVGPLYDGETVRVEIDGVGAIENPVVDGPAVDELPGWR